MENKMSKYTYGAFQANSDPHHLKFAYYFNKFPNFIF